MSQMKRTMDVVDWGMAEDMPALKALLDRQFTGMQQQYRQTFNDINTKEWVYFTANGKKWRIGSDPSSDDFLFQYLASGDWKVQSNWVTKFALDSIGPVVDDTSGSFYTNTTIATTLTAQNTWYELDAAQAWTAGILNRVTFTDPGLVIVEAGNYECTWMLSTDFSATPGSSQEIEYGIMVDGAIQGPGQAHRTLANSTDTGHCSGKATFTLTAGQVVSLGAMNESSAGKILHVEHGSLHVRKTKSA